MKIFYKSVLFIPIIIIKTYQYIISPIIPGACRHSPSCSVYAVDALKFHGLFRGLMLVFNRILRCNPWGTSGYDPVPEKKND